MAEAKEVATLREILETTYKKKPEGLSPFAEKLWASSSIATAQLDRVRRDMTALATTGHGANISAVDTKLRGIVVALADLLLSANMRVTKALDDEGALKQYMKRLESKIALISKAMATAQVAKATPSPLPTPFASRSVSQTFLANHMSCLQELVRCFPIFLFKGF